MAVIASLHTWDVWPYMRDCAKPTTPYAAEQLAKCRTYTEPSKAHIKRIKRERPLVLRVQKPKPKPPCGARLAHNELMHYARQSKSLILKDKHRHV